MITFKRVKYKNIQSVGNHPITIDLNQGSTTLIGGENGSGKSTLLYAFSYVLFGKILSGIKLENAINTVNKKNLEVEVDFEANGSDYKVIRGEKPKKFEIWQNGEQLNKEARASDQQKLLQIILGMDYKLFTQIIVLNKARYEPFMEMGAGDRRKVVEDILDLSIFSHMNDIVKEKIKESNRIQSNFDRDREVKRTEMKGQQNLVQEIEQSIQAASSNVEKNVSEKREQIKEKQDSINELQSQIEAIEIEGHEKVKKQRKEFESLANQFDTQVKTAKKNAKFFAENDVCPTCDQGIDECLKHEKKEKYEEEVNEVNTIVTEMLDELSKVIQKDDQYQKNKELRQDLQSRITSFKGEIKWLESDIDGLLKSAETSDQTERRDSANQMYYTLEEELQELTRSYEEELVNANIYEQLRNLLKDDGIKAVIISEYMGLINRKLNEYLNSMEFYINMKLDENFKESFHAINKEKFTLDNLSTGQKSRVNLAVWLAFLDVASVKNSVVTNVLFLDEILENLDKQGVQNFMLLCREKLSDKQIFVISQRFDEFKDYFSSSFQFILNESFTEIVR